MTARVTDHSGVSSQCTYSSDFLQRNFSLAANSTFNVVIAPALPALRNWDVTVSCDNGATTHTSTLF